MGMTNTHRAIRQNSHMMVVVGVIMMIATAHPFMEQSRWRNDPADAESLGDLGVAPVSRREYTAGEPICGGNME